MRLTQLLLKKKKKETQLLPEIEFSLMNVQVIYGTCWVAEA